MGRRPMTRPDEDGAGGRRSRGRQRFLAHLAGTTQAKLAARLGCARSMVSMIACGRRVPREWRLVSAIASVCGIPPKSWGQPPDDEGHRRVRLHRLALRATTT